MQFGAGAIISALTGALAIWGDFGLVMVIFICALISVLMCHILFEKNIPITHTH